MSIYVFLYNVISIVLIIDYLITNYRINKNAILALMYGVKESVTIKLFIEKLMIIVYIFYWIYNIFFNKY